MRRLRATSRSGIPTSRSARSCSGDGPQRDGCAGRVTSTRGTTPDELDRSPPRRMCSIASRRLHRRDARSSSREPLAASQHRTVLMRRSNPLQALCRAQCSPPADGIVANGNGCGDDFFGFGARFDLARGRPLAPQYYVAATRLSASTCASARNSFASSDDLDLTHVGSLVGQYVQEARTDKACFSPEIKSPECPPRLPAWRFPRARCGPASAACAPPPCG